jgi:hypothetical protein
MLYDVDKDEFVYVAHSQATAKTVRESGDLVVSTYPQVLRYSTSMYTVRGGAGCTTTTTGGLGPHVVQSHTISPRQCLTCVLYCARSHR